MKRATEQIMKSIPFAAGDIVKATAGRDKGGLFMVVAVVDGMFVKIANGGTRPVKRPKLKKIKHLKLTAYKLPEFQDKLEAKKPLANTKLKKALNELSLSAGNGVI